MKIYSFFLKKIKTKIKKIIGIVQAFTLLELLVVMTVLSILGTISYFALIGFYTNARDLTRLKDLKSIDKSITFFRIENGFYPEPDQSSSITYSGNILWTQGIFGKNTFNQIGIINKKPVDIISQTDFSYSLSNDKKEYEIGALTEGEEINRYTIINNVSAKSQIPGKSLVFGNYNGKILKFSSGSSLYLFSFPTIISRDLSDTDVMSIINDQKLAYKGYGNLPASYSGTVFKIDGGFNFNPNLLILYSGSIDDILNNETTRVQVLKNLQDSYSGTIISNDPGIKEIIDLEIDILDPSKEIKQISYDIIENDLNIDLPIIVKSGDDWLSYDLSKFLFDSDTRFITQDSNGDFWFATKNGVSKFSNGNWFNYDESDGLSDKDTRAVIEDKNLFLWFATNKGVTKYDNVDTWLTLDIDDGLIDNDVVAMIEDLNGNLWFATKKGVSMYDGYTWVNHKQTKTGLINKIVTSITYDSSNNIWFATIDGVSVFDGTDWKSYNQNDGLVDNNVLSVYADKDDNIWFGTINGLSKFDGTTWTNYSQNDGLVDKRVQEIYQDIDGNMWFGTIYGLSKFDGTTWTSYGLVDGLVDLDIQSIYQDTDGNIWIGTKKGVTIFYK